TINSGTNLFLGNGGTTGSLAAGTTVTDNGTLLFDRVDAVSFGNPVSGSGGIEVFAGTVTLTKAETYTGTTTIDGLAGSVLNLGVTNAIGSSSDVSVGGTLDLAGFDDAIGALFGSGTVTNSGAGTGTNTLSVNGGSFDGLIEDGATAETALTVTG